MDVQPVALLPAWQVVDAVHVLTPAELMAMKLVSIISRGHKPKGFIDRADLARLLLKFPHLKALHGPVRDFLEAMVGRGADPAILNAWGDVVAQQILPESDEDEFDW